jgi:uncharacterized membrane protein YeaQ/YmgE (transglycosylase-associated protein family)
MVALVIWLIVGAAAGWIAGIVVKGAGFGPLGNIVVGILGSIVAGFIFPLLGIAFLPGLIGDVVYARLGPSYYSLSYPGSGELERTAARWPGSFFLHTSCGSRHSVATRTERCTTTS